MHTYRILIAVLIVGFVWLPGCASFKNTPQQDYVWELGRMCQRENADWRMTRVDAAGRYWIQAGDASGPNAFHECIARQRRAHPFIDWAKAQPGVRSGAAAISAPGVRSEVQPTANVPA